MRYLLFIFITYAFQGVGQTKNVAISATPSWVKSIDYPTLVTDTSMASGGYYDLLVDEQSNQTTQEVYSRYAQLVLSEKGLGNITPISVSYDPSYQQLSFHNITIIRNGTRINQLSLNDIEVLRREQNLERAMYDGDLTAVINLQTLRVGDILEYSFTLKGSNPVFENKFFRNFYFNYGGRCKMCQPLSWKRAHHPGIILTIMYRFLSSIRGKKWHNGLMHFSILNHQKNFPARYQALLLRSQRSNKSAKPFSLFKMRYVIFHFPMAFMDLNHIRLTK